MKKNRFCLPDSLKHVLVLILLGFTSNFGLSQASLVCNDLVGIALDANCEATLTPSMLLEGGPYPNIQNFIIELDKTAPYGNGPWVPAVVEAMDLGKTYQGRVTDPATQNKCWGNVVIKSYIAQCTGLTTVTLDANSVGNLEISEVQANIVNICDLNNTLTIQSINGLGSIDFDCDDLGLNSVLLGLSDQNGEQKSCHTNLLVTDPLSTCENCVTCPPSAYVSESEAINVLLPAFQAFNLLPFETYGGLIPSSTCVVADSSYGVTYQPNVADESWFIRTWVGLDSGGTVLGSCEQLIIFTYSQDVAVSGTVFLDSLENCLKDPDETGFQLLKVVATKLPSNIKVVVTPDANGAYSLGLNMNALDSVVIVALELPNGLTTPCPNVLEIPANTTTQQYNMDFSIQASEVCPEMEVSIETYLMRRCVENTYFLQYCNKGLESAENAYIAVDFDDNLEVISSTIPWSSVVGNTYTFQLGTVLPLHCATFSIKAKLDCNTPIGQTICSEAVIFPNAPCSPEQWNGPHVETSAYCDGDSIKLAVWNTGNQDMTEALEFIVIEDILMYRLDDFQLDAGDSITVAMEANGSTWRIEAEQIPGHPANDSPSSSIEACGGLNTPGLVTAFSQNDEPAYIDISCSPALASCDPNDKTATPTGYGATNIIKENTDLEYKIRFQNTGNDTAFRVVIVDTLSQHLNWASLEAGVSSHAYKLNVFQGGIVHFVFDPIMLPDSNINEPASHGFVSFRIAQNADLPIGTQILNEVSIYFDFNEAVVTNTVLHTIGAPFVTINTHQSYVPQVQMLVQPNPFSDGSQVTITGHSLKDGLLSIYDGTGRVVQTQKFDGNTCKITRNNLGSGLYFLQVTDEGRTVSSAKVTVH